MIRWTIRLAALLIALYGIGFAVFALTLPKAAGDERTDAIVVLTGSPGRLERGFALLAQDRAQAVLISGVPTGARPQDYAARYGVDPGQFPARIALGHESVDTRTNAEEVARWLQRRRYRSIDARTVASAALQFACEKAPGRFVHDNDAILRAARRAEGGA